MIEFMLITAAKIGVVLGITLTVVAYTVLLERWVCAWMQDRVGPNRVGFNLGQNWLPKFHFWGLGQPLADGVKLMLKEDFVSRHITHKAIFTIGPMLTMMPALVIVGAIPWGSQLVLPFLKEPVQCIVANLNVGVLFIFAIASFSVYGIVLAGWASNSKYPFLGGVRSSAQMISYEVCLGLSVVPVFMQVGSLNLGDVAGYQANHVWLILCQPLSFFIFFVSALAETNRTPFDLPEAEQELVAGYNTEYGSTKFAMFFLGEYAAMFAMSALITTLFLGGWSLPFAPFNAPAKELWVGLAQMGIFLGKVVGCLFVFIWIRWTIPRFRYDQLMGLGWKVFIPLTIVNILITGVYMAVKGVK